MKSSWNCEVRQNLFTKTCLTNNYLSCDSHYVIQAWVQSWNIYEKLINVCSPPEFFHKNMSHDNHFSRDPHFVILAWVQSWNVFEKLMKVCSPPQFFHKNMSHEQLLFTWSTFRDSSMGTKLKYFWKAHETLKSIVLSTATGNTFSIICFNVATMVTKMYLFRDCYTFCLCTCSEYIGSFITWFTCALTKPTMDQCFHPNGKHLLDW